VQKNAIMMVDFALDAERKGRETAAARRDLSGVPAALPPHSDDHAGRDVRRPAAGARVGRRLGTAPPLGIAIVGGLIVSQVLTLYTTPVIYLFFDRLAQWLFGAAKRKR
jgi:hypothetical protein